MPPGISPGHLHFLIACRHFKKAVGLRSYFDIPEFLTPRAVYCCSLDRKVDIGRPPLIDLVCLVVCLVRNQIFFCGMSINGIITYQFPLDFLFELFITLVYC